jgi:two-component system chemotaxis response regulator CheB
MNPIRILVVDDSVVIRRVLCDVLAEDPALAVAGTASDGHVALAKIEALKPDLVTLDIEMPVMDGLETLAQIRKLYPRLPVIMFSTLTQGGASATLEALSRGASDYATKPSSSGSMEKARESIRIELIPKIRALCLRPVFTAPQKIIRQPPVGRLTAKRIDIVAIGTSTGGPNALAQVLPAIPGDIPVPIVIVQHMPPLFTRLLADRLASRCNIPVAEGNEGIVLHPGHAWIAPGNFHMTVSRSAVDVRLQMNQGPPENSCRPSVDVLFRSVAKAYGPHILAVVMTGMGSDGMKGAQQIREAGGEVIIQDEASSVVWGMPGAVSSDGQADAIYPLNQLGPEIARRANVLRNARPLRDFVIQKSFLE